MRKWGVLLTLAGTGSVVVELWPRCPHWPARGLAALVSSDPERTLVSAAGLVGWCLAAWLFAVTVLVAAAHTPTSVGRLAGRTTRVITPRIGRRLLEATLGITLAVGPAGAALAATVPALAQVPAPVVAAAEVSFPSLDRPSIPASPSTPTPAASASPSTAVPTPASTSEPPQIPKPEVTPAAPAPQPATLDHVVIPGDTLWGLAVSEAPQASPAQITALWQRWYAANRTTIGADPGLLFPGEHLSLPMSAS